jgi:hypothetical protein
MLSIALLRIIKETKVPYAVSLSSSDHTFPTPWSLCPDIRLAPKHLKHRCKVINCLHERRSRFRTFSTVQTHLPLDIYLVYSLRNRPAHVVGPRFH